MPDDSGVWDVDELTQTDGEVEVFKKKSDDTGKYQTLPGFAVTQEIRDGERGIGREEMLVAYKLMKMSEGLAPFIAADLANEFRRWFRENYGLVRAAMGYPENSGRPPQ